MSIVTDQTITIHGVDVGISKPIQTLISNGDFTYAELSKFAFVGRHDFVNDVAGLYDSYGWSSGDSSALAVENKFPVLNSLTGNWDSVLYTYFGSGDRKHDNYGKMILVYNMVSSDNNITAGFNDNNTACIVTEINPRLLKIMGHIYSGSFVATVGESGSYTIYDSEGNDIVWYDDDTAAPFRALEIQQFDDKNYYVFPLYNNIFISYEDVNGNKSSTNAQMQFMIGDYAGSEDGYISWWKSSELILDFLQGANYGSSFNGANDLSNDRGDVLLTVAYNPYSAVIRCRASSEDTALKQIAGSGLYFEVDGTVYKPIAEGGVVTGYTADLTKNSEWDLINDVTGNTVPDTPGGGGGGGGGGYDDDPWSGASFSGVGVGGAGAFAKCYYMTSTELANLRSWMNSNNVPEGFDPMQQIIGLSQVPVSLSGDDNTTVQFVNSSAVYDPGVTRLVDSGVSTQISMGTPKRYSLGSVNITRRMQERGEPYLDYDCQIELYLPLIGMFSLDTQAVMGRTITAEAVLDPISGTLAAYAYVTRDGQNLPIAYGSTTIGVDLPISAQQYSVARAALKQANAQLGTSLLSSTLSLIAAATAGGKGSGTGAKTATGSTNGLAAAGIREAGADYMKASQAGNVFGDFMQWGRTIRQLSYGNNTAIAGSFGGSTAQWSYPFTPYVKINRPRYEKPSNYKHSQGVPCVQTKTVGSCTGFIQCIGVDVSGITGATDIELQAIQAALTNGVFAGGGS